MKKVIAALLALVVLAISAPAASASFQPPRKVGKMRVVMNPHIGEYRKGMHPHVGEYRKGNMNPHVSDYRTTK